MSAYVAEMRALIGHRMMLLPAVSAIAVDSGRILLGLHADTGRWSTIGGAVDPDEAPLDAVAREVAEELGVGIATAELLGAYGGPRHRARYPNGDESAFVTGAVIPVDGGVTARMPVPDISAADIDLGG